MDEVPPKLMRRVKGVVGAVLVAPCSPSSSSIALSSIEPEFVEMLPRRILVKTEEVLVGDVPESPMVLTESRRLCASLAAPLPGGGIGGMLPLDGLREKRLERAACVIELRRLAMLPLGPFSVDMLAKVRMLSMALAGVGIKRKFGTVADCGRLVSFFFVGERLFSLCNSGPSFVSCVEGRSASVVQR